MSSDFPIKSVRTKFLVAYSIRGLEYFALSSAARKYDSFNSACRSLWAGSLQLLTPS
jgi:hypothetical protein